MHKAKLQLIIEESEPSSNEHIFWDDLKLWSFFKKKNVKFVRIYTLAHTIQSFDSLIIYWSTI